MHFVLRPDRPSRAVFLTTTDNREYTGALSAICLAGRRLEPLPAPHVRRHVSALHFCVGEETPSHWIERRRLLSLAQEGVVLKLAARKSEPNEAAAGAPTLTSGERRLGFFKRAS